MKFEFEIKLADIDETNQDKEGQISVKLPKAQQREFKTLNMKRDKELSKIMRDFALKLIAHAKKEDRAS